eukprot:TRINITY_DN32264_c0_g1_i1.p1 TRINITY_DN32264_c0_g1~~TRINITY_DN32264_c0_g1_i1.p1  ORF type:complete len:365 (-),score=78.17 TRINITY_DN32264_c0_g1_i1:27-1121(-)
MAGPSSTRLGCDELAALLTAYGSLHGDGAQAPAKSGAGKSSEYAEGTYWDQRFSTEDTAGFDWYVTFEELENIFDNYCPAEDKPRVLMVGCGNSELSSQMYKAGYRGIVNIDISNSVLAQMQKQSQGLEMEWLQMDATAMDFESAQFDVAIDKGTLDALMNNADNRLACGLVSEAWRVLKPGGLFILVSHSRLRGPLLDGALSSAGAEEAGAAEAVWEQLEGRWCRLSQQATLINLVRSKLAPGQSFSEGFKSPKLLMEAAMETKKIIKNLMLMEMFVNMRKRKENMQRAKAVAAAKAEMKANGGADLAAGAEKLEALLSWPRPSEAPPEEPQRPWEDEAAAASRDARNQPFCYLYVLRKRART